MKLTVQFGDTKVVIPCGEGDLTIRDLAFGALKRVRYIFPKLHANERVVVHNVTIARDGGILDWDDLVRDVLDDRELVKAQYSIATLTNAAEVNLPSDQLFRHLCTPLVVDLCSDSGADGSFHSGPQSNEASGSGESGVVFDKQCGPRTLFQTNTNESDRPVPVPIIGEDGNSSGSSLSLNLSAGSCGVNHSESWCIVESINEHVGGHGLSLGRHRLKLGESCRGCNQTIECGSRDTDMRSTAHLPNVLHLHPLPIEEGITWNHPERGITEIGHRSFSPTLEAVLRRRRECLEMNWDADEEDASNYSEVAAPNSDASTSFIRNQGSNTMISPSDNLDPPLMAQAIVTPQVDSHSSQAFLLPMNKSFEFLANAANVDSEQQLCETLPPPPPFISTCCATDIYITDDGTWHNSKDEFRVLPQKDVQSVDRNPNVYLETSSQTELSKSDLESLTRLVISSRNATCGIYRPFFTCTSVPPTVEEEEEVSVDYEQNAFTTLTQEQNHSEPIIIDHSGATIPLTFQGPDEDYPLIRQDYFVNSEKPSTCDIPEVRETECSLWNMNVSCTSVSSPSVLTESSQSARGIPYPSVLRWLESTTLPTRAITSRDAPVTVDSGGPLDVSDTGGGCCRTCRNSPVSQDLKQSSSVVRVRFVNTTLGEHLGIQIKPVFIDSARVSSIGNHQTLPGNRIESGLEVHHVAPHGRVARERCLFVGDRILSINGVCLIGIPFEKSRQLFQSALSHSEVVLDVLRYQAITSMDRSLDRKSKPVKPESAIYIPQFNPGSQSTCKPPPPPPPRRSPNTVLTGCSAPLADSAVVTASDILQPVGAKEESHTQQILSNQIPAKIRNDAIQKDSPPENECLLITLRKGPTGLGFSLTGRELPTTKEHAICVKSILPNGAALQDGRLQPGDWLLKVDGLDVASLGQTGTVSLLREKPVNSIVKLLIWRIPLGDDCTATSHSCSKDLQPQIGCNQLSTPDSETSNSGQMKSIGAEDQAHDQPQQTESTMSEFLIPLPIKSHSTSVATQSIDSDVPLNTSTTSPVTLGVSVTVRPQRISRKNNVQEQDVSDNAVFVRTLIEGGAAHRDGRLQIGDRLLSIDDEALSGLSSLEALGRMKSVIARDISEQRSHVRLLVSRTSPLPHHLLITPKNDEADKNKNLYCVTSTPKFTSDTKHSTTTEPSANPTPVKTSMIVSAEVHTSDATSSRLPRQFNEDTRAKLLSANHKSMYSPHSIMTTVVQRSTGPSPKSNKQPSTERHHRDRQRKNRNARANVRSRSSKSYSGHHTSSVSVDSTDTFNRSKFTPLSTSESGQSPPLNMKRNSGFSHHSPNVSLQSSSVGDQSCVNQSSVLPDNPTSDRTSRIYRCDSQGTISSTEIPEDLDTIRPECSSSSSAAIITNNSPTQLTVFSDPGNSTTLKLEESKRFASTRSHSCIRCKDRNGCGTETCRIVFRQPKIDLTQMVLIPFDPTSWTGPVLKLRSELSPDELSRLVTDDSQYSPTHSETVTDVSCKNFQSPEEPLVRTKTYFSDSESSRKDSFNNIGNHTEQASHRRLLSKLFHFVKPTNQHRHSYTCTSSQTDAEPHQLSNVEPVKPEWKMYVSSATEVSFSRVDASSQTANSIPSTPSSFLSDCTASNTTQTAFTSGGLIMSPVSTNDPLYSRLLETASTSQTCESQHLPKSGEHYPTTQAEPRARHPSFIKFVSNRNSTVPPLSCTAEKYADLQFSSPFKKPHVKIFSNSTILTHELSPNHESINLLYDIDRSSCSTAYESVIEFMDQDTETFPSAKPEARYNSTPLYRTVYEDAEALYRYLSNVKNQTDPDPIAECTGETNEIDSNL